MGLPFGVIFAILLIVVFIAIAFIAIGGFLDIGKSASVGLFYEELQKNVDNAWNGQSGEFDFEINLPKGVEEVCFANLSNTITNNNEKYRELRNYDLYEANIFLIPAGEAQGMEWKLINHIDIDKITATKNPYCVPVDRDLRIKKGFYDKLVIIE